MITAWRWAGGDTWYAHFLGHWLATGPTAEDAIAAMRRRDSNARQAPALIYTRYW